MVSYENIAVVDPRLAPSSFSVLRCHALLRLHSIKETRPLNPVRNCGVSLYLHFRSLEVVSVDMYIC